MDCPNCGEDFERIGQHIALSSCTYPEFTDQQFDVVVGALMGDGTIMDNSSNCQFTVGSTTLDYLEYLQDVFPPWATNKIFLDTPKERRPNPANSSDYYKLAFARHPVFNDMRDRWYDNGKKTFPQSLELNPTILRHWYVTDGSYHDRNNGVRPRMYLCSTNEAHRPEFIEQLFGTIGLNANYDKCDKFRINAREAVQFFDYIGWKPVPGFEYKWPTERFK